MVVLGELVKTNECIRGSISLGRLGNQVDLSRSSLPIAWLFGLIDLCESVE